MHGPKPWGCQIYSNPSGGYRANGFDCSGFKKDLNELNPKSWTVYK